MPKEDEFIQPLEISTFSKPILKEMGVDAIFLVTFDIILGPIAHINKLTTETIEYLEFLKDLAHLGEFYTGISHAQIDKVTTRTGEELIIGRSTRKVNEIELIDIAVALVSTTDYQNEIVKMLKFAVRTAYGNPENFSNLIDKILLEYQDIGKKKETRTTFKDLAQSKISNVSKLFENWNGILLVDFESGRLNSAFLPDWLEAVKMDPIDLAQKVQNMYENGIIIPRSKQKFTMVSLKSKQAIVVSTTNLRLSAIIFPTPQGLTKIPQIVQDMDIVNESIAEVGLNLNEIAMITLLKMIDERISKAATNSLMKEITMVMIRSSDLMPKNQLPIEKYESFEGEMQKKFFPGFGKAYNDFDGTKSVMEIAHKQNVPLERMSDFVVYCMTRGLVQVFTKNGHRK
ncbi:MAG: hypothetical protein FK734_07800 [Asgard group archaeon]|nr:hypothetical protein [Asgard group archaeon]